MRVRLEFRRVHPDGQMPWRKRETDAGYDIASVQDVVIPPHSAVNIDTGIQVACPAGYYYTVEGRSSMWSQGVSPYRGIIDGTYCGDLKIALYNISDVPYYVKKGERIAQIIMHEIIHADFEQVEEFSPEYNVRGVAGFGSSGK